MPPIGDTIKEAAGKRAVRSKEHTNVWTAEATTHRCPGCGSHDTRKSFTKGIFDSLIRMIGYLPYRCRKCSSRFIRKISLALPSPDKKVTG